MIDDATAQTASSTSTPLNAEEIGQFLLARFQGVVCTQSWGEQSYFYNPGQKFSRGAYFATLKFHDGPNDRASRLDREGIYRFNFGLTRDRFAALFGTPPARPAKGEVIVGPWDFAALDILMPHPVYGWMGWVCVLNPSRTTLSRLEPLVGLAHAKARRTLRKRQKVASG